MGARTKPQVRCASGARTLRWDAPRGSFEWPRGRSVPPGNPRALPADVLADSVQEFVSKLGLSYRRKSVTTKKYTAEEAGEAVKNVWEKLTFIMNLHDIDASRIINVDETSVRMVPLGDCGWGDADTIKWLGEVVLCCSTSADVPLKAQVQSLPPKSMGEPHKSMGKQAHPRVSKYLCARKGLETLTSDR